MQEFFILKKNVAVVFCNDGRKKETSKKANWNSKSSNTTYYVEYYCISHEVSLEFFSFSKMSSTIFFVAIKKCLLMEQKVYRNKKNKKMNFTVIYPKTGLTS